METDFIYHITTKQAWEQALKYNEYTPKNFETDGFIHCSIERQIPGVLDRFFKGQSGLVQLKIEKNKLERALLFELASDINELFPHIYGPLNLDSVVEVKSIT